MTSNKVVFVVSSVAENEIEKIIENLKERSCGWDDQKPRMVEFVKQSIKIPLVHISNLSFEQRYSQLNKKLRTWYQYSNLVMKQFLQITDQICITTISDFRFIGCQTKRLVS